MRIPLQEELDRQGKKDGWTSFPSMADRALTHVSQPFNISCASSLLETDWASPPCSVPTGYWMSGVV
jgi:hypothetical protein